MGSDLFLRAHYEWLTEGHYRPLMIECGLRALEEGVDFPEVVSLATADEESGPELARLFQETAAKLGLALPEPDAERAWVAEMRLELAHSGDLPALLPEQEYIDSIVVIRELLGPGISPHEARFYLLLGRYVLGEFDQDYGIWLDSLASTAEAHREGLAPLWRKETVRTVTDVITNRSYGGVEEHHLEALAELLARLRVELPTGGD